MPNNSTRAQFRYERALPRARHAHDGDVDVIWPAVYESIQPGKPIYLAYLKIWIGSSSLALTPTMVVMEAPEPGVAETDSRRGL